MTYYQQPLSVSIKEIPNIALEVFPNPIKNSINIRLGADQLLPIQANFYTIHGQLVFQGIIHTPNQKMDLPTLPNGHYFLHLKADQLQTTKKIVIMH